MKAFACACLLLPLLTMSPVLAAGSVWVDSDAPAEETTVLYEKSGRALDSLRFSSDSRLNVVGYDEVWVDYSLSSSAEPAALVFDLHMTARAPYTRQSIAVSATAVEAKYLPVPVSDLDAQRRGWVPKDLRFSLSKLLNATPDGAWRYAMLGDILMSQVRLRVPLKGLAALDIYLPADSDIVGLNLQVAPSERWPLETIVESAVLPAQDILVGKEKFRRIDISRLLSEQLPGVPTPYLKEITVFLRQSSIVPPPRNPVGRVLLQRLAYDLELPKESRRELKMQSRTRHLKGNKRRMVVQLEGAKAFGDAFVSAGTLDVVYPRDVRHTGINVESISLVILESPPVPPLVGKKSSPEPGSSSDGPSARAGIFTVICSLAGFAVIFGLAFLLQFSRGYLEKRFPQLFKGFFDNGHKKYFLVAGVLLLPALLIILTGRNRAADPVAALVWLAMAAGALSMGKDIFSPKK